MDFLATVPDVAVAVVVAVEWHQANHGQLLAQRNRPVVVQCVTVLFHVRRPVFPIARRQLPHELADLSQLHIFIFLAQEEARRVPPLWRATSTTVDDVWNEMVNLRGNMVSYEARFPAAMNVRNNLGDTIWDKLEGYRCVVAYLAFSTFRHQRTAEIDLPAQLRSFLKQCVQHMIAYIRASWGEDDLDVFQCIHESRENGIDKEKLEGIEFLQGWPIRRMFRRQPVFWLFYNFYIDVEWRISWDQVFIWAMKYLQGGSIEPPALPMGLQGLGVWNSNPAATAIWNAAVIEVFTDIQQRFS